MVKIKYPLVFLKRERNEIEENLKIFKKIEKEICKKSKKIEKGRTQYDNIEFIDHLKIALQFNTSAQSKYIKVEINK